MNWQKTILKKKLLIRRKFLMKANLNAYIVMKFLNKSKLKDIPSRNIEESNIVKKKDSVKKKILNAYFVIKLLLNNM